MGVAELLITSVVLPKASRQQSVQRPKLGVDVGEANVASADWQPATASSTLGNGCSSATSATASAVSPVRAMLTGEGTVPQVYIPYLWSTKTSINACAHAVAGSLAAPSSDVQLSS